MSPGLQLQDSLVNAAAQAVRRAGLSLLARQDAAGCWQAGVTAGGTPESDYILLELWRHPPRDGVWNPPTGERVGRAARSMLARQLPAGGFSIYPQGPAEISASVQAYCALKLAGLPAGDEPMRRLRERILELGGIQAANIYTKINLSLFGLFPREHVPSAPPEMMLAGNLIYRMSSRMRAILIPLAIVQALNPGRSVPEGFTLRELFFPGRGLGFARAGGRFSWRNAFLAGDRLLKLCQRSGWKGPRRKAIGKAEAWMLERLQPGHGWGATYPPTMYAILALDLLGYAPDHPARVEAERHFQPCSSPVWDTAIALQALGEAGSAPPEALGRAAGWLLDQEARSQGDLIRANIDHAAQVLLALEHGPASDPARRQACRRRAVDWLLRMQSRDGGWAAFDADNHWEPLGQAGLAGRSAPPDASCPDITGRVMLALCAAGVPAGHAALRGGAAYLLRGQEQDGSWFGRWGVNYIYGTFLALRGLRAAGQDDREAHILRAGEWLRSIQNADGGWGESCAGYETGAFAPAESTASQTAWAILGLLASGDNTSSSVSQGIAYLVETQRADGTWHEELATGTGFPGMFYLTNHNYRNAFPLLALAEFENRRSGGDRG